MSLPRRSDSVFRFLPNVSTHGADKPPPEPLSVVSGRHDIPRLSTTADPPQYHFYKKPLSAFVLEDEKFTNMIPNETPNRELVDSLEQRDPIDLKLLDDIFSGNHKPIAYYYGLDREYPECAGPSSSRV